MSLFDPMAVQAKENEIEILIEENVNAVSELQMEADKHKMGQVIRNLLSNALKFTPRGGMIRVTAYSLTESPGTPPLPSSVALRNNSSIHINSANVNSSRSVNLNHHSSTNNFLQGVANNDHTIREPSNQLLPPAPSNNLPSEHNQRSNSSNYSGGSTASKNKPTVVRHNSLSTSNRRSWMRVVTDFMAVVIIGTSRFFERSLNFPERRRSGGGQVSSLAKRRGSFCSIQRVHSNHLWLTIQVTDTGAGISKVK